MPNPQELKPHKRFLKSLQKIDSIKSVKLVSRVYDERIGNSNSNRIYVFFPDMHIISREFKKEKKYKYGFNHERAFIDLLKNLLKFKTQQTDYPITVCQLGDFIDLWREDVTDPSDILKDFQGVRDYLWGLGRRHSLNARLLLGNHDVDIVNVQRLSARWHFRLFLPTVNRPKVYVTHGDVFDWIEKLPDGLQKWAVYHFSPKEKKPFGTLNEMVEFKKTNNAQKIKSLIHPVATGAMEDAANTDVFKEDRFNITKNHKHLKDCSERVIKINQEFNIALTSAVIGHTHHARISIVDNSDKFFVMMDCGAWFGKYREDESTLKPNCQFGVVCGNDFRIYQLEPDPDKSPQFESVTVT